MASFPDFDPNRYGKAPSEWLRNKAISWNFDPGSTIKATVIAQAIDKGVVKSRIFLIVRKVHGNMQEKF